MIKLHVKILIMKIELWMFRPSFLFRNITIAAKASMNKWRVELIVAKISELTTGTNMRRSYKAIREPGPVRIGELCCWKAAEGHPASSQPPPPTSNALSNALPRVVSLSTGSCRFPSRWEGQWFQSGVRQAITLQHNRLSNKGRCVASDGEKYLVVDE